MPEQHVSHPKVDEGTVPKFCFPTKPSLPQFFQRNKEMGPSAKNGVTVPFADK